MRRRCSTLLLVLLMAACTSDPGVRSERVDPSGQGSVAVTGDSAPTSTTPDSTDAGGDTTGPSDPSTDPPAGTADGVGDLLFPHLGNPGIDVEHYDVALDFDASTGQLQGTVGLDIVLTGDREEITLDCLGPQVTATTVDGTTVSAVDDSPELRIPLPAAGHAGDHLRVEVAYHLRPSPVGSDSGLPSGWFNSEHGSYVLNEPEGARTWLPSNDHPSDKASYTFTITVPAGVTAVANGALADHTTAAGHEVWTWKEARPMATYLIQVLTGDYELIEGTGPHGMPLLSVVLRADRQLMQPFVDITPDIITFYEQYFGAYPLDRYGVAMTDSFGGLAMETQERSTFSRDDFLGGSLGDIEQLLLSHELAHQWFGDAVTPARWQDIWLNESFATYAEWMWLDHAGFTSVAAAADDALANRPPGSSADPSIGDMFGYNSYTGGAVVLHALRNTIGDTKFFALLQRWVVDNNGSSRTTQDFIVLAEEVSGRSLGDFFDTWLFADRPPDSFPAPLG